MSARREVPGVPGEDFSASPSMEALADSARREGFYECAYALLERRMVAAFDEIGHLRDALANERADRYELLGQLAEWRALAFRYGTETQAEKRLRVGTLFGRVEIAREVVVRSDEAITFACAALAKKLRAEVAPDPFTSGTPDRGLL